MIGEDQIPRLFFESGGHFIGGIDAFPLGIKATAVEGAHHEDGVGFGIFNEENPERAAGSKAIHGVAFRAHTHTHRRNNFLRQNLSGLYNLLLITSINRPELPGLQV
jgi:hypothetical protein